MIKVYYKVTRGDWCSGCHNWFENEKQAEELYNRIKGKALWAGFYKHIVKRNIFGKETTLQIICIDGYTKDEEKLES